MKKLYYTLFIFSIIACSQDDPLNDIEKEKNTVNLPPKNFDIQIINLSHDNATINWTEPDDPDNDTITYAIYFNQKLIAENISEPTYKFTNLQELTDYSGKIVARDTKDNKIQVPFSFQTKKYYLKFLKKYDYGLYYYGPNGYGYGSPESMIKTNDQNYLIAGTCSFNGDGSRFFISKIDYQGNELWKKFYDYQAGGASNFRIIESSTGYILAGFHHVLNLDKEGNIIWSKKIDSYSFIDRPGDIKSVAQDSRGDIFLVGGRVSYDPKIIEEAVLTKLSNTGNILWEKSFKSSLRNFFNDVIIDASNELIILGSTETSGITYEENSEGLSFEEIDFWVLKVTNKGDIIWENTYGDQRYDFPKKIIPKINGNYALTGDSWGAYDFSEGRIIEIGSNGNQILNVSTSLSSIFSIAETLDGGFITTGHMDFGNFGALGIFKFSSNGSEEWSKIHQENFSYLHGRSVLIEKDGGYRIAGDLSKNYYYDEEKPELLIYKTDPEGNFE